ncbi:alpha/beta hydrolase [Corynebacterium bovis]|nr:alpha/beta hydrolase-fold protein [Corynebacterium bovis]
MTIAFPDVPLAGHTVTRVLWVVALAAVVILVLAQPRPRRIRTAVGTVAVSAALTATGLAVFLWGFHVPASQISPSVVVADWHPRRGLPRYGTVTTLDPANTASGFQARPASVYLPPAWYSDPRPQLPVLVLMPGIPGSPDQWFSQGAATQAADAWQLSHHGLAPVIITVDGSGGEWIDPLCTDSPRAKVRTYLTRDVPGWLVDRFGVTPDRSKWTIGGLSYGGTCSLQTILNAPDAYGSFLDFSGERTPNNGVDHESTVRDFFDGSEDAFRRQNPEDLLRSRPERFRSVAGRFVAGADDHDAVNDLRLLDGLAVGAGMDVSYTEVPGGHDFETWRTAVAQSLPFVAQRGGIG